MARQPSTTVRGTSFDQATIDAVWRKGVAINGYNPNEYRQDSCGAWIQRTAYGSTTHQFGWEVDHIKPVSQGGSDDLANLQPLFWGNNRQKSDNWPKWYCAYPQKQ